MNIRMTTAAVRVFLALAAVALSPFPAAAFQFPPANAVEIVTVPGEYAGDLWAVARTEAWTESRNTVWSHCEAVLQSYGDVSSTAGIHACMEQVAAVNQLSPATLARLQIGESIALPMTKAEASVLHAPVVTSAAMSAESDMAALTREIAKLARSVDALRTENGREDNPVGAFTTHLDDSVAELGRRIENLGPKIEAALSGVYDSSEGLAIALVIAVVIIAALIAVIIVSVLRRKDSAPVVIDSEELASFFTDQNEKVLKKFAMRHEHMAQLANQLHEERARSKVLTEQLARLEEELARARPTFVEEAYEFDGKQYTIKLVSVTEAGKSYRTPFADSVLESNLKSHFSKNANKPQLRVAAE